MKGPVSRVLVSAASIPILKEPQDDAPLVTELVPGEQLEVLEKRMDWLRVMLPEHAIRLDGRGYSG